MAPTLCKRKATQPTSDKAMKSIAKSSKHNQFFGHKSSTPATNPTTHRTPIGFNRLPFDCLYLIFGRIPLQSLLPLRRLSRTCNSTVIYICARKKRLALGPYSPPAPLGKNEFDLFWIDDLSRYVTDRTENSYESVHFPINQLTKQCTVGLAQLFSSLTELRIHYDCGKLFQSYLGKLEAILKHFSSPTLNVLAFTLSSKGKEPYCSSICYDSLGQIFGRNITVGRFPHLKQLDLCIEDKYDLNDLYKRWNKGIGIAFQVKSYDNILSQLERLSLGYANGNRSDTRRILQQLGPKLVSLSVPIGYETEYFPSLISMFDNVKFESSLTHLRLDIIQRPSNRVFIQAICDRFKALKSVQLQLCPYIDYDDFESDFDDQWIGPLSTLKHLSELRLHEFTISAYEDFMGSLPRVKKLTLCSLNLNIYHGNEFCRTLANQFPNLEELVLVCRSYATFNDEIQSYVQEDVEMVRQHFAHLRTIVCDFTAPEFSK